MDTKAICRNCLYCHTEYGEYSCYCLPDKKISVQPDRPGCYRGKDRNYNVCYSLPQTIRVKRILEEKEREND
jgi:hypothetical protein